MKSKLLKHYWIILFFISIVLASALIISGFTKPVIYDQVIAKYNLNYYPQVSYGIVPHLLIGIYNTVVQPSETGQNIHIKIFAMLIFMVSVFLLARSALKDDRLTALFITLIFLSRYPFLWLSSELITGAALALAIWAMIERFHPVWVALTLVILAFTKPEMALVALIFLICYAVLLKRTNLPGKQVPTLLLAFVIFCLILLMPGIVSRGGKYFNSENRAFFSFGQHYATLVAPHQIMPNPPDSWQEFYKYMENNFKGAKSMIDVWTKYPLKYADFLMLSFGRGIIKAMQLFHLLYFILAGMLLFYIKKGIQATPVERLILISLVGLIPIVLFAFPHIRYLARYYPLAIILILLFLKRLSKEDRGKRAFFKYSLWAVIAIIILTSLFNAWLFIHDLNHFESLKDFWFPD